MTSMTPDQQQASDPLINAFVSASAGTGKTHVLTARVLRMLLSGAEPEGILCLTYTKAAAAEMTERLYAELATWLSFDDTGLQARLRERCAVDADAAMLAHARQLFARVLDLPNGLMIQTFHSFCQALLGRFPLEAGVMPGFRAVDETEAADVMNAARLLALSDRSEAHARATEKIAIKVTENTYEDLIAELDYERDHLLYLLHKYGGVQELEAQLEAYLDLTPGETVEDITAREITWLLDHRATFTGLIEPYLNGGTNDQKHGQLLADWFARDDADIAQYPVQHFKSILPLVLTSKGEVRAVGRGYPASKKLMEAHPAFEIVLEFHQRAYVAHQRLQKREMADMTLALLTLGATQLQQYQQLKSREGLIDFADMVGRTVDMITSGDVADWVLYKLDARITHILVDEAQDTNRAQWAVVSALAAEFFAGLGAHEEDHPEPRSVFAVGDDKQSIFSFQKADPREFVRATEHLAGLAQDAGLEARKIPMATNFRSGPMVLSLVDHVFADNALARRGLTEQPVAIGHRCHRMDAGGLIELWPLSEPAAAAPEEAWAPPAVAEDMDDAASDMAKRVAARIHAMLRDRELLESQNRPIRAGDILILVRKRAGAFIETLTSWLKLYGVPIAGRDRMILNDELAAQDLMALGRVALLPGDDLNLAIVLKGPLVGLSEDGLFHLAHGRGDISLMRALLAVESRGLPDHITAEIIAARTRLSALIEEADRLSPFNYYNHVLGPLGGRAQLVGALGGDSEDIIDIFLELAQSYQIRQPASLLGFLDMLERQTTSIKRDAESVGNQVRIMTVHGAKGLQAPIVFLADGCSLPDTRRDGRLMCPEHLGEVGPGADMLLWTSGFSHVAEVSALKDRLKEKLLQEYRRLLYVALTRPEDRLYISCWRGKNDPTAECWYSAVKEGLERLSDHAGYAVLEDGGIRLYQQAKLPQVHSDKAHDSKQPQVILPPAWLHQPPAPESRPSNPLAPSQVGHAPAARSPLRRPDVRPQQLGVLMHQLLEWLPDLPSDQRADAAARYLSASARGLSEAEQHSALIKIEELLAGAELADLFGPGSRAEVAVSGRVGDHMVSGRLDRLRVMADKVMFADFKTGDMIPASANKIPTVYQRQMALYGALLAEIYPGRQLQGLLVYADSAAVFALDQQQLSDFLEADQASFTVV